ncbi:LITAF-like zinc ribbon domain-containing protein [Aspergillus saccharolyticus JOP 1030-1]|uniref:LITAF domain-containing protein n=1 Tax=Aspergillus saccharolyticus JOP 1030-1 TaxID=1450539 RepID=A0A318ZQ03_9EURO|nr:hypothetical protein BP01DRAFT_352165 [Aspergillus saccharolyticus JOP 1030-1]PYH49596.1 hypothetical protein BP01DRAFT_352165 [Aspergillus saccharolyticus JOP 1030-1]
MAEKNPPVPVPTYEHMHETNQPSMTHPPPAYAQPPMETIQPSVEARQPLDSSQNFYAGTHHTSGYNTATALHALQRGPAPVDCPVCGHREMTRVQAEAGNTTHAWAAVTCICCCLGCIPYLMSSLKDVHHYCGKCGALLATWHNSGRTDVHQRN